MKNRKKSNKNRSHKLTRREFLGTASAAVAAFTIVPRHVLGGPGYTAPSEKLNIACVGVGGMGATDIGSICTENLVAFCDVDDGHAAATFEKYPTVPRYRDFRVMLEKEEKNIDAVLVSTPDNTHAVVAMKAIKMGKHVYCQKPLAHDIFEVRQLTEAARKYKVETQMGIQLHATVALKRFVEMVKSGVIGDVREVHLWSNKPENIPLGADRPTGTEPIPAGLDWDLWLGPAAYRPYNKAYMPFKWRAWVDFGTGRLGDMGCHILDLAFWALDLDAPITIEAQHTEFNGESYPIASVVRYEFAARGKLPPVTVTWHDGGIYPWRPKELEAGRDFPDQGGLYVGEKGTILAPHWAGPRLIPETKMKGFKAPEPFLPRGLDHYQEWIGACKGGPKPLANFDYSGPLTETILLGNVAIRSGKKLSWDAKKMKVTNYPEVNQYLQRQYREGWSL